MDTFVTKPVNLCLPESEILYYPQFLRPEGALELFCTLRKSVAWKQDTIKLFGKSYLQPRLTALYANNAKSYSYSGINMKPLPFLPVLLELKQLVEAMAGTSFTTCLLNLYRDGKDSNGWHADNERELGANPVIASVSLGEVRSFHLKHREKKEWRHKMNLENGSLLLMKGPTQHHWLHQVPKTKRSGRERINLTFRKIV